jgi:fucose permease
VADAKAIATIYTAGLIQGVALVTFPAASAVFMNPGEYGLSRTEFGGMFVPQAILAIISSLLAAGLKKRLGTKRIYLLGLLANLLAMSLLVASSFAMHHHVWAYRLLLVATGFLGIGFGLTVPAVNTFAAVFFPSKVDRAVLVLNALLGLGTALAPIFIALFVGLGIWWGLPLAVGGLLVALLLLSARQTLSAGTSADAKDEPQKKHTVPARFWIFAAFALLYGVCETMNGNWAVPYMTEHFGASASIASLTLAVFWGMVTIGRLLFASIEKWLPERMVCRGLPLLITAAFVSSACVPKTSSILGILTFTLAGLGCSALLPLAISFSQKEFTAISGSVSGGVIAFYQIGYGLAAFGVGPLQTRAGWNMNTIYGGMAAVGLALAVVSFFISRPESKSSKQVSHSSTKVKQTP